MKGIRSNNYASDSTVCGRACLFWGFAIETNGTNNGVVTFYDGNPGSRKIKITCKGADLSYGVILRKPIEISTLLRFTITGTGATVDVLWEHFHD